MTDDDALAQYDELEAALRRQYALERFAREYSAFGQVVVAAGRFREAYRNRVGSRPRMPDVAELAAFDQLEAALEHVLDVMRAEGLDDAAP